MAVNVAEVDPADTVTEAGTEASELLAESEITVPPAGAAPVSVTVHVPVAPEATLDGHFTEERPDVVELVGETVKLAVLEAPEYEAEIVTAVDAVTLEVVTLKVPESFPAGTVTVAGVEATL